MQLKHSMKLMMMSLQFDENRYPGVNAHLNNFLLQPDGGWESFHAEWIVQLRNALDTILPRNYYAMAEKSLQISEADTAILRRTRPDVSVYQVGQVAGTSVEAPVLSTAPTAVMALRDVMEDLEDDLTSVGIYEVSDGQVPGKLVTRIEVLSPGNKPPSTYASRYRSRRYETLIAGVNLVEIDLIHTLHPVTEHVPSYPDRHTDATPTMVLVSRPHPSLDEGQFRIYQVSIHDPLPRLLLPLAGMAEQVFDLQAVYNTTYASTRIFPMLVDYETEPVAIESYNDTDQNWIRDFLTQLRHDSNP